MSHITHDEAREILSRFNASHWNNGHEKARYTIPANPNYDDDIRLDAYIAQQRARDEALRAAGLLDENGNVRKVLGKLPMTRDGCIAGLGAMLYTDMGGERLMPDYAPEPGAIDDDPSSLPSECYSTREAAEAAKNAVRAKYEKDEQ